MQRYTVYFIWKLFYMFRVVLPPIIRSANNCIYSIWYFSHRYCYLPLSWKSWNWFERDVGGVRLTMALEFNRNKYQEYFLGVKGGRYIHSNHIRVPIVSKSGSLNLLEPSGTVIGITLRSPI
jgi:hypothetical protein